VRTSRADLARDALEKSLEVRQEHGYDFRSPLCVYELASRAGVRVQFVNDVSMEGVYVALARPTILVSSLRPLSRRAFTCAHELGHHFFGHGSTIDELSDKAQAGTFQPEEFLAEAFAGFLLMPAQGVRRAFTSRGIDPARAAPEQIYTIAASFGVGYQTLVGHLAYSLRQVDTARAAALHKFRVSHIRERILGFEAKEQLVIADRYHTMGTVDAEVGMLVLLPRGTTTDADHIEVVKVTASGKVFRAVRPGLVRAFVPDESWAVVVRVSRFQYAGLAQYRHLEEADGEYT
jgi:Zn-dependent peptidase ImmA (M78 family)